MNDVVKKNQTKLINLAVVLLAICGYAIWLSYYSQNIAEIKARPVETALIKAGANKKCNTGDTGRGPDNSTPWYIAVFVVNKDINDTQKLITQAVNAAGYQLSEFDNNDVAYIRANVIKPGGDSAGSFDINKNSHYDESRDHEFCTSAGGDGLVDSKTTFSFGASDPAITANKDVNPITVALGTVLTTILLCIIITIFYRKKQR